MKKINGILWDEENLKDENGNDLLLTYEDAVKAAKKQGKRLPTKKEMLELIDLGSEWDSMKRGRYIGGLFFHASGLHYRLSGELVNVGSSGFCWLFDSRRGSRVYGVCLYFNTNYVGVSYEYGRTCGMSVRCVKDVLEERDEIANTPFIANNLSLTRRDYFAAMAMQGAIAGRWSCPENLGVDPTKIAEEAVEYADALIKELDKLK